MKRIAAGIIFSFICLSTSGCATIKESKGDSVEDLRKLIFDAQLGLTDIIKKTFIIKDIDHTQGYPDNGQN